MATIKMTPEDVRSLSKAYSVSAQEIHEMLMKLQVTQEELAKTWEGEAFRSFDEQFNTMKPTVQKFAQLLEDIYNQLQKIARIVEATDQEISQTVRNGF